MNSILFQSTPRISYVKEIEILRINATIDGGNYQNSAIASKKIILDWARGKAGRDLPEQAWSFEEFESYSGGRNVAAAKINKRGIQIWSLRSEDPDKEIAGRNWSTEFVVGFSEDHSPQIGVRLLVNTNEREISILPHVPNVIVSLIEQVGLRQDGVLLTAKANELDGAFDVDVMCDFIADNERKLPVVVVTEQKATDRADGIDLSQLSRALAGIAHIYFVPDDLTRILTDRFGRKLSVFNGGVRIYQKGFHIDDDPFGHRLFLGRGLTTAEAARAVAHRIRADVARISALELRLGHHVLDFSGVKTASRKLRLTSVQDQAGSAADKLKLANELIDDLDKTITSKDIEIEGYIALTDAAELREQDASSEIRRLQQRLRILEGNVSNTSQQVAAEVPLPEVWTEFLDWFDSNMGSSVVLTGSARRMIKNAEYTDVRLVAKMIKWLAGDHRVRRLNGGGSLRDFPIENGLVNAPCGGDSYTCDWQGRRYDVDWHIKTNGNMRDPTRCLRIYYFWEEESQMTVIDHLPSHRKTSAS